MDEVRNKASSHIQVEEVRMYVGIKMRFQRRIIGKNGKLVPKRNPHFPYGVFG